MKLCKILFGALLAMMLFVTPASAQKSTSPDDPSGFVVLADVAPDIIQEIRYYSTYNFVGDRIDGYEQPCALMTIEAAQALKAVSDDVMKRAIVSKFTTPIARKWQSVTSCVGLKTSTTRA